MNTVSHSKCKKCNKSLPISKLKENPNGLGMICSDNEACAKQQQKTKEADKS